MVSVNDGAAQLIHASFEHTGVGACCLFKTPWPGCGRAGVMRLVARELVFNESGAIHTYWISSLVRSRKLQEMPQGPVCVERDIKPLGKRTILPCRLHTGKVRVPYSAHSEGDRIQCGPQRVFCVPRFMAVKHSATLYETTCAAIGYSWHDARRSAFVPATGPNVWRGSVPVPALRLSGQPSHLFRLMSCPS